MIVSLRPHLGSFASGASETGSGLLVSATLLKTKTWTRAAFADKYPPFTGSLRCFIVSKKWVKSVWCFQRWITPSRKWQNFTKVGVSEKTCRALSLLPLPPTTSPSLPLRLQPQARHSGWCLNTPLSPPVQKIQGIFMDPFWVFLFLPHPHLKHKWMDLVFFVMD